MELAKNANQQRALLRSAAAEVKPSRGVWRIKNRAEMALRAG